MVRSDSGQRTVYHVISRTALNALPFKMQKKDKLIRGIQQFSMVIMPWMFFGFAVMTNHFLRGAPHNISTSWLRYPGSKLSDDEVRRRFMLLYNTGAEFPEGRLDAFGERFSCLSHYVKDVKQIFYRY